MWLWLACAPPPGGDAAGRVLASASVGTEANDFVLDVAARPDGGLVMVGDFGTLGPEPTPGMGDFDPAVVTVDVDGTATVLRRIPGADRQEATGVAVLPDGDLVVTGLFAGSIDWGDGAHTSVGEDDVFVTRLAPDGHARWTRTFGGANFDQDARVVAVPDGVWALGWYWGDAALPCEGAFDAPGATVAIHLDDDGQPGACAWLAASGDQAVLAAGPDEAGDIWVAGRYAGVLLGVGGDDVPVDVGAFRLRIGADGAPSALVTAALAGATPLVDGVAGAAVGPDGEWAVGFVHDQQVTVRGFTPTGADAWAFDLPVLSDLFPAIGLALDDDDLAITGHFEGVVDLGDGRLRQHGPSHDAFVAMVDEGDLRWSGSFGSRGIDTGDAVVFAGDAVWVAGTATERLDTGDRAHPNLGYADWYAVRLAR